MSSPRPRADRSLMAFAAFQAVFLAATVGWGAWRASDRWRPALPTPDRHEPLRITPQYDMPEVVSDEQLERTLARLRLPARPAKPRVNHVDHALRLWTVDAQFAGDEFLSGSQMRQALTDHRQFAKAFGSQTSPLLIDRAEGVSVRTRQGDATASHVDHTLACLAEVGTPLDYPLVTATRQTDYGRMLAQSLRDFRLNQAEYEWSTLTYALYLPPVTRWQTSERQWVSFDDLAERAMRESLPRGVCYGTHRLYALVALLRIHDQTPILSEAVREKTVSYLKGQASLLANHQHPEGFWNGQWPTRAPESSQPTDRDGDRLSDRLLATGHALEWLALASEEIHPPRPTLVAAGQWLVGAIDRLSDDEVQQNYTYLTHAGRALALWRSRSPAEVMARLDAASANVAEPSPTQPPGASHD